MYTLLLLHCDDTSSLSQEEGRVVPVGLSLFEVFLPDGFCSSVKRLFKLVK